MSVLERAPKEFENMVAQVGIPSGIQYEDGTDVAFVAAIHEFGAPAANIPARPFIMPTVAEQKDQWTNTALQLLLPTLFNPTMA